MSTLADVLALFWWAHRVDLLDKKIAEDRAGRGSTTHARLCGECDEAIARFLELAKRIHGPGFNVLAGHAHEVFA